MNIREKFHIAITILDNEMDSPMIIFYFGSTNNIFADCTMYIYGNDYLLTKW